VLVLEKLNITYSSRPVLRDVSLQVLSGEIVGLIGLNGAGKTSLLKTILDLRPVQSGEVHILDRKHDDISVKKNIAYLPENFQSSWFLTGMEFVEFSLKLSGLSPCKDEINTAAESIALAPDFLNERIQKYSKGMKQKLGLLATILVHPRLVVLDEPMSGLDPQARSHVKQFIRKYKAKDQAIILSSHILEDMDDICDRIYILNNAKVAFEGTPSHLKEEYGTQSLEKAFLKLIN
jgi:ABC-2 type transport system ATP-binding protein